MGILSNIFHKIFPESHPAVAAPAPGAAATPVSATPAATVAAPAGPAEPALAKENNAIDEVDVEAILDKAAKQAGQPLNWRTSIVDLLKALQLDSSLEARKSLAQELHYTGDTNDSASMNVWLHRQVMHELAENGGKVPADLRD